MVHEFCLRIYLWVISQHYDKLISLIWSNDHINSNWLKIWLKTQQLIVFLLTLNCCTSKIQLVILFTVCLNILVILVWRSTNNLLIRFFVSLIICRHGVVGRNSVLVMGQLTRLFDFLPTLLFTFLRKIEWFWELRPQKPQFGSVLILKNCTGGDSHNYLWLIAQG